MYALHQNLPKQAILACISLMILSFASSNSAKAEGSPSWRETNSQAIQAMRKEQYEESEKLFNKALSECKLPEDSQTVKGNLALLLQKLGRLDESNALGLEKQKMEQSQNTSSSLLQTTTPNGEKEFLLNAKSTATISRANPIAQVDLAIQEADKKGDLETLQGLFQKKAELIKARDKVYTMEYAYTLHYRAQVLHHLKRDTEADAIEYEATRIRNANKELLSKSTRPIQSILSGSSLRRLDMKVDKYTPSYSGDYTQDYTNPNHKDYIDSAHKNIIDRSTTNIQKTPSATSTINSYKRFGE